MQILRGDSRRVLKKLIRDGVVVDAIVTDPPYGFATSRTTRPVGAAKGALHWDGEVAFEVELWELAYQMLRPGGHLIAFGSPRTYHRLATAVEDAGFEIRDQLLWMYGSGMPKSRDVGKDFDRRAGRMADRPDIGIKPGHEEFADRSTHGHSKFSDDFARPWQHDPQARARYGRRTGPVTELAQQWDGWGTGLKPAHEPAVLARKPMTGSVADNLEMHGTGALNIDACRVPGESRRERPRLNSYGLQNDDGCSGIEPRHYEGRWPANLIHDGSAEVVELFPQSRRGSRAKAPDGRRGHSGVYNDGLGRHDPLNTYDDSGSAARYFYTAKPSAAEKALSDHPTIKPLALMKHLVALVTPPGGVVLDMFAGSGTTGVAAIKLGMEAILIEREPRYVRDIKRRLFRARKSIEEKKSEAA